MEILQEIERFHLNFTINITKKGLLEEGGRSLYLEMERILII